MKKRLRKVLSIALALFTIIGAMPVASLLAPVDVKADGQIGVQVVAAQDCNPNISDTSRAIFDYKFYAGESAIQGEGGSGNLQFSSLTTQSINIPEGATKLEIKFASAGNDVSGINVFGTQLDNIGKVQTDGEVFDISESKAIVITLGNPQQGGNNDNQYTVNFDTGSWTVDGVAVTARIDGEQDNVSGQRTDITNSTKIWLSEGFDSSKMAVKVAAIGGLTTTLQVSGENTVMFGQNNDNANYRPEDTFTFSIVKKDNNQGGGQPGPSGPHADVILALSGCNGRDGGAWQGVPMVNDYGFEPDQAGTLYFRDTWKGTNGRGGANVGIINGTSDWQSVNNLCCYDNLENGQRSTSVDGAETGVGTRKIIIATQWSETVERVIINGNEYSGQLINEQSPLSDYFGHFREQMIYSEILLGETDVENALSTNGDTEFYDIQVAVRPITAQECRVGNFRWSSDDKKSNTDTYVGNAIMELQSITYNGETYTDIAKCPWVGDYSPNHEDFETGAMMGDMFVPAGAEVTMKITPYQGYQVQSFKLSGGQFTAEDEPGVFTFTVGKGNFHLGGTTIKVEDKVEATATSVSDVKATITAGGDYAAGSANLSISNASPSDDKKSEFATAAGEQEVDLIGGDNAYLAIDLDQVIYKAKSRDDDPNKANDVWTQVVHDLGDGYAEVTMTFGNDVDVSTVVLLHNIGDGEDFETIRPISYDEANHTATFRIKSFSTFAIAKAHTKTTPVTPSDTNTNTNGGGSGAPAATTVDTVPKTAESFPMALLIILSIASLGTMTTVVVKRRRM